VLFFTTAGRFQLLTVHVKECVRVAKMRIALIAKSYLKLRYQEDL